MDTQKDWTVMFYLAGDNDLSPDMARAAATLGEIAADHPNINVFAYFDGMSPDIPTMYIDLSAPAEARFHPAATVTDRLYPAASDGFREDSADAHSVVNFVDWCVNGAPDGNGGKGRRADRYALVLSGHSAGFLNFGMLRDETAERHLPISRLGWVLDRITRSRSELLAEVEAEQDLRRRKGWPLMSPSDAARDSEVILGQKLSILAFDSCLMGMLETAEEFATAAETLIASEGRIPNAGWNYATLIELLASATESAARPASEFVLATVEEQRRRGIGGLSIDLAAWDLRRLEAVRRSLADLAAGLTGVFAEHGGPLYREFRSAVQQAHISCQTYLFEQSVDLGDFCEQLRSELSGFASDPNADRIITVCDEVIEAIRGAITANGFAGPEYQFSNGIALFFPWSVDALRAANESYRSLRFVRRHDAGRRWLEFLELYVGKVTRRQGRNRSEPTVTSVPPTDLRPQLTAVSGTRVPSNPVFRVPSNPVFRVPSNPVFRVPSNPVFRVPSNPVFRVPSNPVFRGGGLAAGISSFAVIKNVSSDWDVCGFRTSDAIDGTDDPEIAAEPRE